MSDQDPARPPLSRRSFLRGSGAAAAAAGTAALLPSSPAAAQRPLPRPRRLNRAFLTAFDAEVRGAMETFAQVGAAVALVEDADVVYDRGFGVRDVTSGAPVTPDTRFRLGSNVKSMTSLLLARYVEDGLLDWETRAVDLWPEFRAPTEDLTEGLRMGELLGMGTGLAETPTVEFFMSAGDQSALDVLRSIAHLDVIAPPGQQFSYNNTLVAAAPYLALLAQGTPPADLEQTYADELARVLFGRAGMRESVVAADPRPLGDDHATGYTRDVLARSRRSPFISVDGIAPAGEALSSSSDMARYVLTQMRLGLTPEGRRIVAADALARTHRPGVALPVTVPDTTSLAYGMGWFVQRLRDGRRLLWHSGGIDGFGTLMGFFPEDRIGFVILTNLDPASSTPFVSWVQGRLFSRLFGLYDTIPATAVEAYRAAEAARERLADATRPVAPEAVRPFLGLYSEGFQLRLAPRARLRIEHDIRSLPVAALASGGYVVTNGPGIANYRPVTLSESADGSRTMTIAGFEPVRWLTGD